MRRRRNQKLKQTELLPAGLRPVHHHSARDMDLLQQVLPPDFPKSRDRSLLRALSAIAREYEIEVGNPDWVAATLFSLALEHPRIAVVKRARGAPKNGAKKIADERSFLEWILRLKVLLEDRRNCKVSFSYVALKHLQLHLAPSPERYADVDVTSHEFEKARKKCRDRISRLRKTYPDLVEKYREKDGKRVHVEIGVPIPDPLINEHFLGDS